MQRVIEVSVRDKIAWQTNRMDYICGNSNFAVDFNFDSEWDGIETKTARFIHGGEHTDVVFTGKMCAVPYILNVSKMEIGVYAGDLYTTTPAKVPCKKSILCGAGTPANPPPNVYNQIMEMLNDLYRVVEDIAKRVEALEKNEDKPDEPDIPDIPDEPDEPVIPKLTAPVIRLETVAEPEPDIPDEPDEPDGNTPAILGVAVLGRTILGEYGGTLPKLSTPAIRLETVEDMVKLSTPVIQLVTASDPVEPDEPDPVIPKLATPAIRLETVAEPEPEFPKLTAPEIKLEEVIMVLDAPVIELVEV